MLSHPTLEFQNRRRIAGSTALYDPVAEWGLIDHSALPEAIVGLLASSSSAQSLPLQRQSQCISWYTACQVRKYIVDMLTVARISSSKTTSLHI
jgi:hypothetical protein